MLLNNAVCWAHFLPTGLRACPRCIILAVLISTMKKLIIAITLSVVCLSAFAQSDKAKIDSAKVLMKREQYLSAFNWLMSVDSSIQEVIPLAVILFTSHSTWHDENYKQWAFMDKPASGNGRSERVEFEIERLLNYGVEHYPKNCAMYFSISRLYSWVMDQERRYMSLTSLRAIRDYLVKVTPASCRDEGYYFAVGYANTYLDNPEEGAKQLQEVLSLNPQAMRARIELAYAYVQAKQPARAIEEANKLFSMTKDRGLLAQAARIMGEAYELQKDNEKALFRYTQADTLHRTEFFNQFALLRFCVKTGNQRSAQALNAFIGGQSRESMHIYLDAYEIYQQYGRLGELVAFCEKTIQDWPNRPKLIACANFTLGLIRRETDPAKAKEHFKKAKELGIDAETYKPTRNHPRTQAVIVEAFKSIG